MASSGASGGKSRRPPAAAAVAGARRPNEGPPSGAQSDTKRLRQKEDEEEEEESSELPDAMQTDGSGQLAAAATTAARVAVGAPPTTPGAMPAAPATPGAPAAAPPASTSTTDEPQWLLELQQELTTAACESDEISIFKEWWRERKAPWATVVAVLAVPTSPPGVNPKMSKQFKDTLGNKFDNKRFGFGALWAGLLAFARAQTAKAEEALKRAAAVQAAASAPETVLPPALVGVEALLDDLSTPKEPGVAFPFVGRGDDYYQVLRDLCHNFNVDATSKVVGSFFVAGPGVGKTRFGLHMASGLRHAAAATAAATTSDAPPSQQVASFAASFGSLKLAHIMVTAYNGGMFSTEHPIRHLFALRLVLSYLAADKGHEAASEKDALQRLGERRVALRSFTTDNVCAWLKGKGYQAAVFCVDEFQRLLSDHDQWPPPPTLPQPPTLAETVVRECFRSNASLPVALVGTGTTDSAYHRLLRRIETSSGVLQWRRLGPLALSEMHAILRSAPTAHVAQSLLQLPVMQFLVAALGGVPRCLERLIEVTTEHRVLLLECAVGAPGSTGAGDVKPAGGVWQSVWTALVNSLTRIYSSLSGLFYQEPQQQQPKTPHLAHLRLAMMALAGCRLSGDPSLLEQLTDMLHGTPLTIDSSGRVRFPLIFLCIAAKAMGGDWLALLPAYAPLFEFIRCHLRSPELALTPAGFEQLVTDYVRFRAWFELLQPPAKGTEHCHDALAGALSVIAVQPATEPPAIDFECIGQPAGSGDGSGAAAAAAANHLAATLAFKYWPLGEDKLQDAKLCAWPRQRDQPATLALHIGSQALYDALLVARRPSSSSMAARYLWLSCKLYSDRSFGLPLLAEEQRRFDEGTAKKDGDNKRGGSQWRQSLDGSSSSVASESASALHVPLLVYVAWPSKPEAAPTTEVVTAADAAGAATTTTTTTTTTTSTATATAPAWRAFAAQHPTSPLCLVDARQLHTYFGDLVSPLLLLLSGIRVNVNSDTEHNLVKLLPLAMAKAIIAARTAGGPFRDADDLFRRVADLPDWLRQQADFFASTTTGQASPPSDALGAATKRAAARGKGGAAKKSSRKR